MKRLIGLAVVFLLAVVTAGAQQQSLVSATSSPTPRQLFERCGAPCDLELAQVQTEKTRGEGSGFHAAVVAPAGAGVAAGVVPFAVLRTPGNIVNGAFAPVYIDVLGDFPVPVFIAGRVARIVDGRLAYDQPFYAARNLSVTRYGAGYFHNLDAGAVIPIWGEVALGNAGETTTLQVIIYPVMGGQPQVLRTTMFSQLRPSSAPQPVVAVTGAEIFPDGENLILWGRFPKSRLVVEIGNPEWDSGVAIVDAGATLMDFSRATSALILKIPPGKMGNYLYPRNWAAVSVWGITILTSNGECFSFPGVLQVKGSQGTTAALPAQ